MAKLLLVMPATNSTSERSFSCMRHVKSYLRSTMTQERLNNLMILHVHKSIRTNSIYMILQMNLLVLMNVVNKYLDNFEDSSIVLFVLLK